MNERYRTTPERHELSLDALNDVSGGEIVVTKGMIELDSMKIAHNTGAGVGEDHHPGGQLKTGLGPVR